MQLVKLTNQYGATFAYCRKHIEENRKHLMGTITETIINGSCKLCEGEERNRIQSSPEYISSLVRRSVHSRFRPFGNGGYITFYGKDDKSPTGISSIGSCDATEENYKLIRSVDSRISPLSPTENLYAPSKGKYQ